MCIRRKNRDASRRFSYRFALKSQTPPTLSRGCEFAANELIPRVSWKQGLEFKSRHHPATASRRHLMLKHLAVARLTATAAATPKKGPRCDDNVLAYVNKRTGVARRATVAKGRKGDDRKRSEETRQGGEGERGTVRARESATARRTSRASS